MRLIGIVGTAMVHLAIVIPFFIPACTYKYPPPGHPPGEESKREEMLVNIMPFKSGDVEAVAPPNPDAITAAEKVDPCPDKTKTYEGVGIIYDPNSFRVLKVPADLPAYRAGVRPGDLFLHPYPGGGTGISDGYANFDFVRKGQQFSLRIKTEMICYDGKRD